MNLEPSMINQCIKRIRIGLRAWHTSLVVTIYVCVDGRRFDVIRLWAARSESPPALARPQASSRHLRTFSPITLFPAISIPYPLPVPPPFASLSCVLVDPPARLLLLWTPARLDRRRPSSYVAHYCRGLTAPINPFHPQSAACTIFSVNPTPANRPSHSSIDYERVKAFCASPACRRPSLPGHPSIVKRFFGDAVGPSEV